MHTLETAVILGGWLPIWLLVLLFCPQAYGRAEHDSVIAAQLCHQMATATEAYHAGSVDGIDYHSINPAAALQTVQQVQDLVGLDILHTNAAAAEPTTGAVGRSDIGAAS